MSRKLPKRKARAGLAGRQPYFKEGKTMSKNNFAALLALTTLIGAGAFSARAEQGLITHKAISLDLAMSMAQGSLEKCRSLGCKCAVTVLGATGRTIIAFEDDGANLHRFDVARKKAYTA